MKSARLEAGISQPPSVGRSAAAHVGPDSPAFERYLTPSDAADVTRLSVKTILRAIRQGHLVAARFGNRVRIAPDALRAWLERAEGEAS